MRYNYQTLSDGDYRRLAEFRHLLRRFMIFSEAAAQQAGLTMQQHQALLAIRALMSDGPVSTGNLAERLCLRHHSAVGLVDRLATNGLVRRKPDTADRRQVFLVLTSKARKLLERLSAAHREELRRLAPLLSILLEEIADPPGTAGGEY